MASKDSRAASAKPTVDPELLYDVRLVERYIARGVLDREAHQEHCRQLPDMADHAQPLGAESPRSPAAKG